jgi:hypothetical protein
MATLQEELRDFQGRRVIGSITLNSRPSTARLQGPNLTISKSPSITIPTLFRTVLWLPSAPLIARLQATDRPGRVRRVHGRDRVISGQKLLLGSLQWRRTLNQKTLGLGFSLDG